MKLATDIGQAVPLDEQWLVDDAEPRRNILVPTRRAVYIKYIKYIKLRVYKKNCEVYWRKESQEQEGNVADRYRRNGTLIDYAG